MAKSATSDRIAKLKARLNTLEQKEKQDARKRDTRRKIIVGGAVLAALEKDPAWAASIRGLLAASVGRQKDREAIADLLGFYPATPIPESQKPTDTAQAPQPSKPQTFFDKSRMAWPLGNKDGSGN
jgi:hypothetical protein